MDARSASRYHEVYARWQRDPEGFWAEAAAGDRLVSSSRKRSSTRTPASTAAGSPAASATPATTALDRHVADGRGDQTALIYDSPGHRHEADLHLRPHAAREVQSLGAMLQRLRRRQGRPRHHLHADGAGGGVRDARLRAHRRDPFGGVRRLRRRRSSPPASTTHSRSSSSRRAAASRPARVVAYKPLLDEAIELATHKPQACLILQRPQCEAAMTQGRDHDWAQGVRARASSTPRRATACRSPPPTRSTSSTRRARPACPRAWCATMAATWSR